jgi:uncharacterized hydrophobic protein (TIGR00271 family)
MNLPGVQIKPKHRRDIYEDVAEQSRPSGSYYVMMALSTVIAAYGLLINSAAVVVGAMLVAPLMGPIFGIALALVSGNRRLLWQALQSEIFGILIALSVGVLVGLTPFRMPLGSDDWLVRTQPTLHDLAIALASGLAGGYAMIDERVSPSLPGVAISVAVLPPLATCGLAAAAMNWEMTLGAMQLFIANFFAIQVAAAVVFSLFGMLHVKRDPRTRREEEEGRKLMHFFTRFSVSITILLLMAAFMTQTLVKLASDRRLSSTIESTLSASIDIVSGARLSDTDFNRQEDRLRVTARVMTPRLFDTDEIAVMEEQLEEEVGGDVRLVVRLLISRDMDRQGTVYATPEDEQLAAEQRQRREFLQQAARIVSEHLDALPGAELSDIHRSTPDGMTTVTAIVRAPEPIGPQTVAAIEEALQSEFDRSLRFTVSTVLTRAASSDDFLYEETTRRALTEREALLSGTQTAINSWLSRNIENATVDNITVTSVEPPALEVDILTSRALTEEEARQMSDEVTAALDRSADLSIKYELGGRLPTTSLAADEE